MGLHARARRSVAALARRGWLGPPDSLLQTAARAVDRSLTSWRSPIGRVAQVWDGLASDTFVRDLQRRSWTGLTATHLNHNYLMTGSRDCYWVDWLRDQYFAGHGPLDVLSLGCGSGHFDRILGQHAYAIRSITGLDISPAAIARAQQLADSTQLAPSVSYQTVDLNHYEPGSRQYDFIYFFQSLHHIAALERLLDHCRRALRPGGRFLVNEFVGPSRFQWTPRQMDLANEQLATLPPELRRDVVSRRVKTSVHRPTVGDMMATDPSEAVRSAEIEPLVKARFSVVGEWNWGGTLNNLIFQEIAGNFDETDSTHRDHVDRLIEHENTLIRDGVIPSDFKVFLLSSS